MVLNKIIDLQICSEECNLKLIKFKVIDFTFSNYPA